MSEYTIIPQFPNVDDYRRLRAATGLSPKTHEAATTGLANTWFGISILHGDEVVGMGRIVGDGGCFFQFVDGAIMKPHQGRGMGFRLMRTLVDHARDHMPPCAYVTLFADGRAGKLYSRYGFAPTAPESIGMHLPL
jgi:GNAT superfamily N-acetyltransferase